MARRRARGEPGRTAPARLARRSRAILVEPDAAEEADEEEAFEPPAVPELEVPAPFGATDAGAPATPGVVARRVAAPAPAETVEAVLRTTPGTDGAVTDGVPADGAVPPGADTFGVVTDGVVTDGVVTLGVVTDGVVTLGAVTDGVVATGVVTLGVVTDGVVTLGTVTDGVVTVGTVTGAMVTLGALTDGTLTDGRLTLGDATAADCLGRTAAVPASGCAAKMPSPAAAIPITTPRLFPMAGSPSCSPASHCADGGRKLSIPPDSSPKR